MTFPGKTCKCLWPRWPFPHFKEETDSRSFYLPPVMKEFHCTYCMRDSSNIRLIMGRCPLPLSRAPLEYVQLTTQAKGKAKRTRFRHPKKSLVY